MGKVAHHYVPQFYLRNFSSNKKSIGLYLIKQEKYVKDASIKKQACKDYLYGKDEKLENFLMIIESNCSKIIGEIIKTQKLPTKQSEDYCYLLLFMLLSEARTLERADASNEFIDVLAKTMLTLDRKIGISKDFIEKISIKMTIPNLFPILASMENCLILSDLYSTLLINNTDRQFLTSDNPLIRYNQMYVQRNYALRGYGLVNIGIQLFFPISPRLRICLYDGEVYDAITRKDGNIEINKGKQLDEINKLIYLNAYEYIFFNNKVKKSYINRIVENNKSIKPRKYSEVKVSGTGNERLIAYSLRKVTEKINLGFFKIRDKYLNMPLPPHMASPIRPYAQYLLAFLE